MVFCLLIFLLALPSTAQNAFKGKVVDIEKGDQLTVQLDSWKLKVRLHGIEAAKTGELARVAQEWTRARVANQQVQVGVRGTAAKGIVYGDVSYLPGEHNIAIELAEQGLATWTERYAPSRKDLMAAQARAQAAHAGIWGNESVEVIRLRRTLQAAPKATPTPQPQRTAKLVAAPKSTPTPQPTGTVPSKPNTRLSPWPLLLGILCAVALLGTAERVSRDARRLRQRPTLLTDQHDNTAGFMKLRGIAHTDQPLLVSIAGRIPGLYIHEITQVYHNGSWRTTYDETDKLPFTLDDGSGQVTISEGLLRFMPIRVARFYNDFPVEKWHPNSYGGDIRTEVFFIPADVTVVVFGDLAPSRTQPLMVIEGDERRLTHQPVRLAMALIVGAAGALLLGGYFMLSGVG
nr:thermonuclease family protein [Armatimonas rosea]